MKSVKYVVVYSNIMLFLIIIILFKDILCKGIIHPMLRILSSQKVIFPSGALSRSNFATKLFEAIYFFGLKQGHLVSKTIQRLFLVFDKLRHFDPLSMADNNPR